MMALWAVPDKTLCVERFAAAQCGSLPARADNDSTNRVKHQDDTHHPW
jgi:hypothetical protein